MEIAADRIDPDALKVVERLRRFDYQAYLVGGCVRDLLLGGKPKDFDVATSATPNDLRRIFRNCRIIGRRFRLAHIFFGSKVIETATFRANPRELEEEQGNGDAGDKESENDDLLIRRDNVFGTAEQDARRRDFTVNGLFYDCESRQVIDHVDGLPDIESRVLRTIGDPDIRFREDPVRILRAVKFAARCDLAIEPETYRRMMEHAAEVQKCSQARVSEEFYRLLRAGAARRSLELMLETRLLDLLVPELTAVLRAPEGDAGRLHAARFWAYLAALDRDVARHGRPPTNALLLAILLFPLLRDALHPAHQGTGDIGVLVAQTCQGIFDRLRASRRDGDLARQVLLGVRYLVRSGDDRRRGRVGREAHADAVALARIVADAEAAEPAIAGQAMELDAEALAPPPPPRPASHYPVMDRAEIDTGWVPDPSVVRTPIPPAPRPSIARAAFLGNGSFGGRWGQAAD